MNPAKCHKTNGRCTSPRRAEQTHPGKNLFCASVFILPFLDLFVVLLPSPRLRPAAQCIVNYHFYGFDSSTPPFSPVFC